jgi:hypothetical protein
VTRLKVRAYGSVIILILRACVRASSLKVSFANESKYGLIISGLDSKIRFQKSVRFRITQIHTSSVGWMGLSCYFTQMVLWQRNVNKKS